MRIVPPVLSGLVLISLFALGPPVARADALRVVKVEVVATSSAEQFARSGIHRARLDQAPMLHAAVVVEKAGKRWIVSDAGPLQVDGRAVKSSERLGWESLPGAELRWHKIEPEGDWYDNTRGGFHWDPIRYRTHPVTGWGAHRSRLADARPLGYPDTHGGAGTMAFQVSLRWRGNKLSSPGPESIDRGGLSAAVTRVALRRDDSYLGRLSELFNTPYIWGSAGTPPPTHQAERLIGSDCADLAVYGARQLGLKLPYRSTWQLPEMARTVTLAERVDGRGRYLDAEGKPLRIGDDAVRIGDLLLFPRHVGALAEDRAPVGVLDTGDIMLHTLWKPPAEEPIEVTPYAGKPLRVLRWPTALRASAPTRSP